MPNDLVNFWREAQTAVAPYAHIADISILRANPRFIDEGSANFESYIGGSRFAACGDDRLHLSLLPVPYTGDLGRADIFVMLLNPGFSYTDYWGETHSPEFRKRLVSNLYQEFDNPEYGFLYLDPQFCWHSGFVWWEKKFRELIHEIAKLKFAGNYRDALRDFSHRIASIELVPYHSAFFHEHRIIKLLPSVAKAREFVHSELLPGARAQKKTIIVTRQAAEWNIKPEEPNIVVYTGGHTRGASLSPRSAGGKAILRHYGLE